MDFIFEEDMDEVGSDIEAYCPKCKADTSHTVITKYEEEVRRVQCSPCGDVHAYRKPRGEVEDDVPEPVAAKKRAAAKKPSWQEAYDKAGNKHLAHARPYTIRDHYHEGDIVSHPKFGVGFVTEISENKAEVTFQDERRVLVHNRPDLAAQMPAIAPVPAPREEKVKGKRGGVKKIAAAEPPAPVAVAVPLPVAAAKAEAPRSDKDKGADKGKSATSSTPTPAAAVVTAKDGKKASAPMAPVEDHGAAKKAAAKKAPEPTKKPSAQMPPVSAVQGKAARAQAAAKKKVAAKGGSKPAASSKPAAKAATRPAHPAHASHSSHPSHPSHPTKTTTTPARSVRPAARAARAEAASKGGSKLKKKAR